MTLRTLFTALRTRRLVALVAAVVAPLAAAPAAGAAPQDAEALQRAVELFHEADPVIQEQVLQRIEARIDACEVEGVRELVGLRDRARRELRVKPAEPPAFWSHSVYAPNLEERHFLDAGDRRVDSQVSEFRTWENRPQYHHRVRYDYAADVGRDSGVEIAPTERLWVLLYGFVPGHDVLIAWLESKFDDDASIDRLAEHFDKAYCDRVGNCYPGVTLFDAYASQMQIEMSDVDVIAFARHVLKDRSYVSPIPAGPKRERLYEKTKEGFLEYFRHRTLCEAAANCFVYPDSWLRSDHEGLRPRLFELFAMERSDVDAIRRRLVKYGDRDGFVEALTELGEKDPKIHAAGQRWRERRNEDLAAIIRIVHSVLQEHGFL